VAKHSNGEKSGETIGMMLFIAAKGVREIKGRK
jgi:hypothetical protein